MSDIDDCLKSVRSLTRDRGEVMRAGNYKIEEIRARHQRIETTDDALLVNLEFSWANADRAYLLAEVERLRADHDALRGAARECLETLGGALKSGKFEMAGTAEMAHFVRQAMQKLDSLVFDRAGPRPAGLEKLHEPHGRAS